MKTSVFQLAAFGGVPLYDIPLHVGQPNMPHRESLLSEIEEVLNSGILTNHGPRVRAFEDAVCSEAGTRHCIAVCNATTALQTSAARLCRDSVCSATLQCHMLRRCHGGNVA